ncbi:hypothetical protein HpCK60_05880 [Helicobacter pylori]
MKIKAMVMALLVSGSLLLGYDAQVFYVNNYDASEYEIYEQKLINELDLSVRENQKKVVAIVLDNIKSIVALNEKQKQLINEVELLQTELAQLRQQLHKQNKAKK